MPDIHAENTVVTISTIFRFHVKNKENKDDRVQSHPSAQRLLTTGPAIMVILIHPV